MAHKFFDILFNEGVKSAQTDYGSRNRFQKLEGSPDRNFELTDSEVDFIESRDGFYLATMNESGYPYIQFRGGPPGFLKALDERRIGFADFRGNLQYISVGNLRSTKKAALFLMDYANRRRLKILADVEVKAAANDPELIGVLGVPGYDARIERTVVLNVKAFDWNCPQHITPRFTVDEIKRITQPMVEQIERLELELKQLKQKAI